MSSKFLKSRLFGIIVFGLVIFFGNTWLISRQTVSGGLLLNAFGQQKRPHIIFLLIDDMGWSDVHYNGAEYPTRYIDALANSGIILSNYYVQPLCAPTRVALMTGRVPEVEVGLNLAVFQLLTDKGLPTKYPMISEVLKRSGYSTHMVGKWHLGLPTFDQTPLSRGFDSYFGVLCSRCTHFTYKDPVPLSTEKAPNIHCNGKDFVRHLPGESNLEWGNCLYDSNTPVGEKYLGEYDVSLFTRKTQDIISNHAQNNEQKPLFIFLSHVAVHAPWEAPMSYINSSQCANTKSEARKTFCGMMQALDESIGDLTRTLQEVNYIDNTIIVFSSDNGGWVGYQDPGNIWNHDQGQNNFPFRAGKGSYFEGGTRVPGFIWGNPIRKHSSTGFRNLIQTSDSASASTTAKTTKYFDELFTCRDWFLTLQSLAQVPQTPKQLSSIRDDSLISAYDQSEHLRTGKEGPRKMLLHDVNVRGSDFRGAIRNRNYKIVFGANHVGCDGWFNAADYSQAVPICGSIKECLGSNEEQYFFKISTDEREKHPIDIQSLTEEEQFQYNELKQQFEKWTKVMSPSIFPREFGGVWSMDLHAQALPRFWNCSFHPFISTPSHPIQIEKKCEDKVSNICPVEDKEGWRRYARLK